ncbi:MAG: proton-conducting transporter membrane subunit [Desulfovibrionaceae bacterium]|nr:proton-conducting transporter membrane subunit [Desulfovibrionaceae bacterium]
MLATVGGSIFFVPEGRFLIATSAVSQVPEVPWYFLIMLLAAATGTVQVWLMSRVACCVLFDEPHQGTFIDDTVSVKTIVLAVIAAVLCIFKTPLLNFAVWVCGAAPIHHSSPHISSWIFYGAAFLVALCYWLYMERIAIAIVVATAVICLLTVFAAPMTPMAQMFLVLVSMGAVIISVYSIGYMSHNNRKGWYWFFLFLTFSALCGIVSSDSVAEIYGYGFWEMMTFATFILVAHEGTPTARNAATKYFVMCCGGALFMLPGIILLSTDAGQIRAISAVAPVAWTGMQTLTSSWGQVALILCVAGFGTKAGVVPLHWWLPDAHPAAPSSVSAPLSGIITKMGFFGIAAIIGGQAGPYISSMQGYFGLNWYSTGMVLVGTVTLFYGEVMALRQKDLKRMLAYSTIGQIGEISITLGLMTVLATTAAFFHILNHAVMKDLLFLGAGALILSAGSRNLADFKGAASQMPVTVTCIVVGILSLMGLPPFAAFYSKFAMVSAAVANGNVAIAAILLIGSFIGVLYYTRILNTLVFEKRPAGAPVLKDPPRTMQGAMIALAALAVLFGFLPNIPYELAAKAAAMCSSAGESLPSEALLVSWPSYVVLPLIGAIISAFFRRDRRKAGWASVAILACTSLLAIGAGGELDNLSYAFCIIVPALGALNMAYAIGYMEHSHTQWRFYCIFTAMCGGLIGMAAAPNLFSFFMFWEVMSSWTLYMALAHEGDKVSLREAGKYFLFNIAGASFIFVGVAIIGGGASMTVFGVASAWIPSDAGLMPLGLALLAIGFVMKAAQLPFRIDWQMHPAVAPTPVSGYISSMLLKSSIIGLCKLFLILGQGAPALYSVMQSNFIMWVGGITIVMAAAQAIRCNQLKLVFIYSTVSQIGYMVLAIAVAGYALATGASASLGLSGSLLHLVNHVFFKDLLFLVCGALMFMTHKEYLSDLGGLGRKMPFTLTMFFIAGLSVVGIPPTSGFCSKWVIYHALMEANQPILALLSLFGSVLTLAYIAKFMHAAFLGQPNPALDEIHDPPMIMRVPMVLLAIGCFVTGIFPGVVFAPISAIVAQFNIPPVPFTLTSIGSGSMGWNPFVMFVIMLVPFGFGMWFIHRFVRVREIDVHNCGREPEMPENRMRPSSVYGGLPAFMRTLPTTPAPTKED